MRGNLTEILCIGPTKTLLMPFCILLVKNSEIQRQLLIAHFKKKQNTLLSNKRIKFISYETAIGTTNFLEITRIYNPESQWKV